MLLEVRDLKTYFYTLEETVKAVDRVWEDETLRTFWRHGRLVPNTSARHPYQIDVPEKYVVTFKPGKGVEERIRGLEQERPADDAPPVVD